MSRLAQINDLLPCDVLTRAPINPPDFVFCDPCVDHRSPVKGDVPGPQRLSNPLVAHLEGLLVMTMMMVMSGPSDLELSGFWPEFELSVPCIETPTLNTPSAFPVEISPNTASI